MRQPLKHVAMQTDRFGISDRATAAIATATLIDFGLITANDTHLLIGLKLEGNDNG